MKDFMKAACGLLLMYFILGSQMVGIFVGAKLAHTGSCTIKPANIIEVIAVPTSFVSCLLIKPLEDS